MSEQYSVPTENEILKWLNDCAVATRNGEADHFWCFEVGTDDACDIARAALEKWGKQPVSIPASERLPGRADCDAEGRCWLFRPGDVDNPDNWYLDIPPAAGQFIYYGITHWRPFHDLPLPA